jgi:hypothetical protein
MEKVYLSFTFFSLVGFIVFFSPQILPSKSEEKISPLKVDLEIKRTNSFLILSVICKNLSEIIQRVRLILTVQKSGKGESKIYQAKTLKLSPGEISLPFVAQFSVSSEDSYLIILEVKDLEGRLIERKELISEAL